MDRVREALGRLTWGDPERMSLKEKALERPQRLNCLRSSEKGLSVMRDS
jgi:hypothetical protein